MAANNNLPPAVNEARERVRKEEQGALIRWLFDRDAPWQAIVHASSGLIVHMLFLVVLARHLAAVLRR